METLKSHAMRGTPYQAGLKVAAAAISQHIPSKAAYNTLVAARPEAARLEKSWPRIWSKAKTSLASPPRDRRLTSSRRAVAAVLDPRPQGKGVAKARRLTAVVASHLLTRPDGEDWRSVQMSEATLAVLNGLGSARATMRTAADCRWLSIESRGQGNAPILKLRPVHGGFSWDPWLRETVDALVARTPEENMLASLILSAEHCVWDSWSATVWVCALELASHRDLQSRAAHFKARKILDAYHFPINEPERLREWADAVAAETGADIKRAEAERAREEKKAARLNDLAEVKRLRSLVPAAPKRKTLLPDYFQSMLTLMMSEPEGAREVRTAMLKRAGKWHDEPEKRWVTWLVNAWAERAPVTAPDVERERARRRAVAALVVSSYLGEQVTVPEQAAEWVTEGVAWVRRKDPR